MSSIPNIPKDLEGLLPTEEEIMERLENSGLMQMVREGRVPYYRLPAKHNF